MESTFTVVSRPLSSFSFSEFDETKKKIDFDSTMKRSNDSPLSQEAVKRQQRHHQVDVISLAPFDLIVDSPPVCYAATYTSLCNFMEARINNETSDDGNENNQFCGFNSDSKALLDQVAERGAALNFSPHFDANGIEREWRRIEEQVNGSARLQLCWKRLKDADKVLALRAFDDRWRDVASRLWWLDQSRRWMSRGLDGRCAAFVLELFYRFVWTRFVARAHVYQAERIARYRAEHPNAVSSASEVSSSSDGDEIVDSSILERRHCDSEPDESDASDSSSDVDDIIVDASSPTQRRRRTPTASSTSAIADDDEDDDDAQVHRQFDAMTISNANDDCDDDDDDDDDLDDDASLSDDNDDNDHVSLRIQLPDAPSLFFADYSVKLAIDKMEGALLVDLVEADGDRRPMRWHIGAAVKAFLEIDGGAGASAERSMGDFLKRYNAQFAPFLAHMGIATGGSGERALEWRWLDAMPLEFVDQVYVTWFRTLTDDGAQGGGVQLAQLMPELTGCSDSHADAQLAGAFDHIVARLHRKGRFDSDASECIAMLDELLAERAELEQTAPSLSASSTSSSLGNMRARLVARRRERLNAVNASIALVEKELQRRTGGVDARRARPNGASLTLPSLVPMAPPPNELLIALPSAQRIMESLGNGVELLLPLCPIDISLSLLARLKYGVITPRFFYSGATKRAARARARLVLEHIRDELIERAERVFEIADDNDDDDNIDADLDALLRNMCTRPSLNVLANARDSATLRAQLAELRRRFGSVVKNKRNRHSVACKVAALLLPLYDDVSPPLELHRNAAVNAAIDALLADERRRDRSIVLVVTAHWLWSLRFKTRHGALWQKLASLMLERDNVRLLVYGHIDEQLYDNAVDEWLPWRLACNRRLAAPSPPYVDERASASFLAKIVQRQVSRDEVQLIQSYDRSVPLDYSIFVAK
jgi:hypothetical protein